MSEQPVLIRARPARFCATKGMVEEVERNIREAIRIHLEGKSDGGELAPQPTTLALEIEVPTAA